MNVKEKTVYVGLSGGVDSAVSAALLKDPAYAKGFGWQRHGFNVTGVFIKIWQPEFIECTWERDRLDAMRVAAFLNIPFLEIDLSAEYKKQVIDEMIAGYTRGETPNPDILCNERIKFGSFFKWARAEGAGYVATGHYARVCKISDLRTHYVHSEFVSHYSPSNYLLVRGMDNEKDQSYFLYALSQEVLAHTLFPVGGMTKREVRAVAERFGLPNAARPDSQGLCFVGDVSMREFLSRYVRVERGAVVDMGGRVVGEHEGAALYTIGQRHGFTHASVKNMPHYVVGIDTAKNEICVSPRREDAMVHKITMRHVHWISGTDDSARASEVQVRYREATAQCKISKMSDEYVARLSEPRIAARGQAAVFYRGEECLGGGTIV